MRGETDAALGQRPAPIAGKAHPFGRCRPIAEDVAAVLGGEFSAAGAAAAGREARAAGMHRDEARRNARMMDCLRLQVPSKPAS